jgi:hypothetical protein
VSGSRSFYAIGARKVRRTRQIAVRGCIPQERLSRLFHDALGILEIPAFDLGLYRNQDASEQQCDDKHRHRHFDEGEAAHAAAQITA